MIYALFSVLRPLNITARVILVMKPRQENYTKPMFDIKVELDDISFNLTRDQVIDRYHIHISSLQSIFS